MYFGYTLGLLAFLSLLPFIILYLRKPKPKDEVIPSLMFLMQENQKSRQFSFLQRFTANTLFFLQLLILCLLSLAIAAPFVSIAYDVTKENTIIIIDASASMQTKDGSETRFDKALEEARKHFSGRNTIILAENTPIMVLEEEGNELANDVLGKLQPRATSTNLGDALLLAKDILGEKPGRIVIISDFIMTEGPDVRVIKTLLTAEDKVVDFVDVATQTENTGIIKLDISKFTSKVHIKNFDNVEKQRKVEIKKDGKTIASSGQITIAPYSIENFEFNTPPGVSTVELSPGDDFPVDDVAYIATPEKLKMNVFLVTNVEENQLNNLELALRAAPDINLNIANPPVLTITNTGEKIDPYKQDVIIFYRVAENSILPGTFKDIEDYVAKGGSFIMAAQPDIGRIDMDNMQLLDAKTISTTPARVCINTVNSVTKHFEKEACFTTVSQYVNGELEDKGIVFASANEVPIIIYKDFEAGNIAYYGIMDEYSDFKNLPSYPIFWNSLLNFMVGTEDIKSYNYATGSVATFEEQEIKTPTTTLQASKAILDEQGVYEFSGRRIAVNLLNEKESEVSTESRRTSISEREALLSESPQEHDFSLVFLLSVVGLLLVFGELVYVKMRGDV
jgi:hypothetical protein